MSNIYYLRNNADPITFNVQIGTTGNPAANVSIRRSGGSVKQIDIMPDPETFNIPETALGISAELAGASMVVTLVILFTAQDDLDQALAHLSVTVSLSGGLDGTQSYVLQNSEKTLYAKQLLIVATKAIKLQTNNL